MIDAPSRLTAMNLSQFISCSQKNHQLNNNNDNDHDDHNNKPCSSESLIISEKQNKKLPISSPHKLQSPDSGSAD